jgi:hypothetical protein
MIGNPAQPCQKIGRIPGAAGGQMQSTLVENGHPDVLIFDELRGWENAAYIRDQNVLGGKTALIVLGHAPSEE